MGPAGVRTAGRGKVAGRLAVEPPFEGEEGRLAVEPPYEGEELLLFIFE